MSEIKCSSPLVADVKGGSHTCEYCESRLRLPWRFPINVFAISSSPFWVKFDRARLVRCFTSLLVFWAIYHIHNAWSSVLSICTDSLNNAFLLLRYLTPFPIEDANIRQDELFASFIIAS
jgi:hypothetical protein